MDDERRQTESDEDAPDDDRMFAEKVDWKAALDVTAGDEALLLEVLDAFQIETPQMLASIRQATVDRDAKLLHRAAHTAKNAFYNIGAQATGDIAFKLEVIGEQAAFDQVPPLLEKLESDMRQVSQEVTLYLNEQRRG